VSVLDKLHHSVIPVDISPTEDFGYFCGLILGDGDIVSTKNKNYLVRLGSTRAEFVQLFLSLIRSLFPQLNPYMTIERRIRTFPNGQEYNTPTYRVIVNSKILYEAFRPYKLPDYHWKVPDFLTTKESIIGFIRGIFDAEATVIIDKSRHHRIDLSSKHGNNLEQIKVLLGKFGIQSRLYVRQTMSHLYISTKCDLETFKRAIDFNYLPKKRKLERVISIKRGQNELA